MNKISVVILTRNEEKNIATCLENLEWAEDCVVVDQFSTDETVEICKRHEARVFKREMDGFAQQKQFGVDRAQHDWVFVMDANEVADEKLKASILRWKQSEPTFDGYQVYRKTFYLGQWIRYCNWYKPIVRFFDRRKGQFDGRAVHENVIVQGRLGTLEGNIMHMTYDDLSHHLSKINMYTSFDAVQIEKDGVLMVPRVYLFYFVIKPIYAFLQKYVIQKGYKEGVRGLFLSVITAFIVFFNYAKLWEMQNVNKRQNQRSKW